MQSLKILITNAVALNGGDAAILEALVGLLRAAFGHNTRFVVYDNQPAAASRYYPELTFRKLLYLGINSPDHAGPFRRKLRRANVARLYAGAWCIGHHLLPLARLFLTPPELRDLLEYSTADLIVTTGGTYLVENYDIASRIFDYKISLLLRRPLVFFTQSLGPFSNPSHRLSLRRIFENSILILLRDKKSLNNLLALGAKNVKTFVTADASFALADHAAVNAAADNKSHIYPPITIAVSVREWKHFKRVNQVEGMRRYVEALRALTVHLVQSYNAKITYLSTCQGIPEYWSDDSKIASKIVEMLPEAVKCSVVIDRHFHSPADLRGMIKKYDLVIATRMHMAIVALGAGVPVLPIAYEFKTQELFERLGQTRWVQNIEQISGPSLIKAADSFLHSMPQIRNVLFSGVSRERRRALESVQLVKQAFDRWRETQKNSP